MQTFLPDPDFRRSAEALDQFDWTEEPANGYWWPVPLLTKGKKR